MLKLATLCYIQKEDETLMLHRTKKENDMHEGKWNGIGGKFESGESPEECAQREILEETGLTAHKMVLKGFLTFPQLNGEDDWYVFVFVIPEWSGELIESTEGDLAWHKTAKLTELPLWEGDKYFLPKLSEKGFFTGKFCYNKDKLLSHDLMDY